MLLHLFGQCPHLFSSLFLFISPCCYTSPCLIYLLSFFSLSRSLHLLFSLLLRLLLFFSLPVLLFQSSQHLYLSISINYTFILSLFKSPFLPVSHPLAIFVSLHLSLENLHTLFLSLIFRLALPMTFFVSPSLTIPLPFTLSLL